MSGLLNSTPFGYPGGDTMPAFPFDWANPAKGGHMVVDRIIGVFVTYTKDGNPNGDVISRRPVGDQADHPVWELLGPVVPTWNPGAYELVVIDGHLAIYNPRTPSDGANHPEAFLYFPVVPNL